MKNRPTMAKVVDICFKAAKIETNTHYNKFCKILQMYKTLYIHKHTSKLPFTVLLFIITHPFLTKC